MNAQQVTDALRAVLLALPSHLPVEDLDHLWIFQPRDAGPRETGLLVASLAPSGSPTSDPHRIFTLQYESDRYRPKPEPRLVLTEQGSAPLDRLERVIAGVLSRLGDEDGDPAEHEIRGSSERWGELLSEYEIVGG